MSQPGQKGIHSPGGPKKTKRELEIRSGGGESASSSLQVTEPRASTGSASSSKPSTSSYSGKQQPGPPMLEPSVTLRGHLPPAPNEPKMETAYPTIGKPGSWPKKPEPLTSSGLTSSLTDSRSISQASSIPRSMKSEPTSDRFREVRYWHRSVPEPIEDLMKGAANKRGKYIVMMLTAGQAGMFSLANPDSGQKTVRERSKRHTRSGISRLRDTEGEEATFTGTEGCYSCLGVYFELKDSRFFCAHIDAWHVQLHESPAEIKDENERYRDLQNAVRERLELYSMELGWTATDVRTDKMLFVCPYPEAVKGRIVAGIMDFLKPALKGDTIVVNRHHGFMVQPGGRNANGGLKAKLLGLRRQLDGTESEELVPPKFKLKGFINQSTGAPMLQYFTYTHGAGPTSSQSWHQLNDPAGTMPRIVD